MERRSRMTRGALAVVAGAWLLVSPASMTPVLAQSSWVFQLEWDHAGGRADYYRLCVDGACIVLGDAHPVQGTRWRAALPLLPQGEHRLVVEACGQAQCLAGEPDLMIRVLAPSPRRPPIDILDGPRIPVSR